MTQPVRRVPILILALLMLFPALALVAGGPPADHPGLPILGQHGPGIGYCVTLEGSGVVVNVPFHAVSAAARQKQGLPPLELLEFTASVQNAVILAANQSGKADLAKAAHGKYAFPDLGIPATEGTSMECWCSKSTCYG